MREHVERIREGFRVQAPLPSRFNVPSAFLRPHVDQTHRRIMRTAAQNITTDTAVIETERMHQEVCHERSVSQSVVLPTLFYARDGLLCVYNLARTSPEDSDRLRRMPFSLYIALILFVMISGRCSQDLIYPAISTITFPLEQTIARSFTTTQTSISYDHHFCNVTSLIEDITNL